MIRALAARTGWVPDLRDFGAFLLVGGGGAVAFMVVSSLIIEMRTGVPEWVIGGLCWAAMIVPVYLGHRAISFRTGVAHGQALPRYILVQAVGVVLAALFSYLAHAVLGVPSLVGAAFVACLTAGLNFAILRLWAFAAA